MIATVSSAACERPFSAGFSKRREQASEAAAEARNA